MNTSYPTGGGFASQNSKTVLVGALQQLPQQWQLTPVGSNKAPYRQAWQSEKLDRQAIAAEIKSGRAKGYGLLTGPVSGGLLAVDADGPAAHELLARYGELPPTVAFTSGRPGRCQYLFRISQEYWGIVKTTKINTGVKGDDGKDQLLELRWDGCQSVLPPSTHPTTGRYKWVNSPESLDTAECPIWLLELILNSNPSQVAEPDTATAQKIAVPVPASIPLELCLAKSSRHLLNGVNSGGRNNAGAKLARDLIGTANYLREIGQAFDGDPQQMLESFGSRCSPPLPTKEVQAIWKSAERGNATPACTAEGVETCVRSWYWNNYLKNAKAIASPKTNNIISHAKFQTPNTENLETEIEELFEQNLKLSKLKIQFATLAQKYRLSPDGVEKIYIAREKELEQEADREDVGAEVARLLDSKKSQIKISEIIPLGLAAPIEKLAALLNLQPECYLTALLTQISSLFKVGTEVMLRRDSDFRAIPNYFAGIVAESSQKKTPILQAIIDRPMRPLREKARKEFEQAQSAYESELAQWKDTKKGEERGPAPKPPRQKLYSFSKTTGEAILYQVAAHPEQALMYRCDELAGLFKSANQYRGGKGSDDEDLLEFWTGTNSTVNRAAGVAVDLEGLLLSVFGTIQPDVLASFLKDCSDSNGKFARFDFVIQPLAASKPPLDDSGSFDITPMLTDLYTKIDALPATFFELDRDAKRYFTEFLWAVEHRRVHVENMQGKRAMLGKMPTKVGKLCIVIHALNCIFNNRPVTPQIPRQVVEAAVKFVTFTAAQVDVLYTEFSSDRKALAPNLTKIILLAERKGGTVSARDVSIHFTSKYRPTSQQIREWFSELADLKYGEVTTKGQKISFTLYPHPQLPTLGSNHVIASDWTTHTNDCDYPQLPTDKSSSVGNCGQSVGSVTHTSNALSDKSFTPSVGSVGKISPPLQNSNALMMSCTTENEHQGAGDIKVGDRVEVVGSDIKHYNGVTGTVIDVWAKTNTWGCTVDFDKSVGNASFCDFPAYELRKLHDSDG